MMQHTALQAKAFDAGEELRKFESKRLGAIASFSGLVRSENEIIALSIEHHPVMTQKALKKLCDITTQRYHLLGVTIIHRYGTLKLGEPIVFVAAASEHRKEAMEAIIFMMDRLKTDVPLWKKEIFADGSSRWIDQKQSDVERSSSW